MISHEYVKTNLEKFGYVMPLTDNTDSRMKTLNSGLSATEEAIAGVSKQLAAMKGKEASVNMVNLQAIYQNLLIMTLRDQLLFEETYKDEVEAMIVRFQSVLDFINQSTSTDPRFKKVHADVKKSANAIRKSCKVYQASDGSTKNRYTMLNATLCHIYEHAGITFLLATPPGKEPVLTAISKKFPSSESFILDGSFLFSKVKVFTPKIPAKGE